MKDFIEFVLVRVCPKLRKSATLLAATFVALLLCTPLHSQVNTGRISGAITDQTGGAIAGATVTLTDVARGETRPLMTDGAGQYAAPNLIPGSYTIRAEYMGFQTVQRENITVGVGSDIRVDITLPPGEQTQTVTVTEALPIVNTTNAQTGGTLDDNLLLKLPLNGRNFQWVLNYVPGVFQQVGEGLRSESANGTPLPNQWNVLIDGLYDMPFFILEPGVGGSNEGGQSTVLPLDAIQEMNVVTTPKAEYGWAPSITMSVGLKSGTNAIHGSAYAYGRDQDLDARNAFAQQRTPTAFEQWGATVGGPIKKDKIFYFAGYEGVNLAVDSVFTTQDPSTGLFPASSTCGASGVVGNCANSIPDAIAALNALHVPVSGLSSNLAGCVPSGSTNPAAINCGGNALGFPGLFGNSSTSTTTESHNFPDYGGSENGLGKLDYHINDHHSLSGSYYVGDYTEYVVPGSTQNFTQQFWEDLLHIRSEMLRGVEIWSPNSSFLNELRGGWNQTNRPVTRGECTNNGDSSNPIGIGASPGGTVGGVAGPIYSTDYQLVSGALGCGIPTLSISGFTGNLGFSNARADHENAYQGSDTISYTRSTHQFKVGVDVIAMNATGAKVVDTLSGTVAFGATGFAAFSGATPLEDFLAGDPSGETVKAGDPVRSLTMNRFAVFAQDDWRLFPKLTLNLGVRWEDESAATDDGLLGNFNPGSVTGMLQDNQVFKGQSEVEPRLGFAYDVHGNGRLVLRAGGSLMYAIPQLESFVGGGGQDYGSEPTGARLYNTNGSYTTLSGGTITSAGTAPAPVTNAAGVITTPLPFLANTPIFNPIPACGNGMAPAGPVPGAPALNPAPCTGTGGDPNLKALFPVYLWHLDVQRAFTSNLSLDVGYVGSHSSDIYESYNINEPAPGIATGSSEISRRPFNSVANNGYHVVYPWFNAIDYYANLGGGNYDALQINVTQRVAHGVSFTTNYAFGHAQAQDAVTDVLAPKLDYGSTGFDVRQHFSLTASYAIPGLKAPAQLLTGWGLNASINATSALPLDISDSKDDVAGTGAAARWSLFGPATPFNKILGGAGTVPCYGLSTSKLVTSSGSPCATVSSAAGFPAECISGATSEGTSSTTGFTGLQQLSAIGCYAVGGSAIVPPAQGTFGNMTPYELRGKGNALLNVSVTKDWKIKERLDTQFRLEIFNLLNRTQYGETAGAAGAPVGSNLGAPGSFGLATGTPDVINGNPVVGSGGPREMQVALRLTF